MKSFVIAGVALAAGMALADADNGVIYEDKFSGTLDETVWNAGTLTDGALVIDEGATCTAPTVTGLTCRVAEMKVYIAEAGEEPTALDSSDKAQFALATGSESDGKVTLWVCSGTTAAWEKTSVTVAPGSWITVRMVFTYTGDEGKTCELSIDGNVVETYTNISASASAVSSLEFAGATKVDGMKLADLEKAFSGESNVAGLTVPYEDLAKWGVKATAVTDDQAAKLVAGLAANDTTTTFAAKSLGKDGEKTVVTVPCNYNFGQTYKVILLDADGKQVGDAVTATAGEITNGTRPISFAFPATTDKVVRFKIQATNK